MVRAVTAYLRDEARAGRPVNAFLAGLLRAAAYDRDNAYERGDGWGSDAAGKALRALYAITAAEQALKREGAGRDGHDIGDTIADELASYLGGGPTMGNSA